MVKQALKRLTFHRCTHTCISSQRVSDVKTSLLKLIVLQECISFGATIKKNLAFNRSAVVAQGGPG